MRPRRILYLAAALTMASAALAPAAIGASGSPSPAASPPKYVVGPTSPSFTSTGTHPTFDVELYNGTQQASPAITVVSRKGQPGCTASTSPQTAAAGAWTKVTVTLSGCTLENGAFSATVKVGKTTLPAVEVQSSSGSTSAKWSYLYAFPGVILVSFLFLAWAMLRWKAKHKPGEYIGDFLEEPLGLGSHWSITDSWGANLTVVAGAIAGLFASSGALATVLGSDGEPTFALIAVAAAIAVAIAGAAPLAVGTFKKDGDVTPLGLLLGAVLIVGASGGELVVLSLAVRRLELGGVETPLAVISLVLGVALLAAYAFRTINACLSPVALPEGVAVPTARGARRSAVL
jgi:hypothetical protein